MCLKGVAESVIEKFIGFYFYCFIFLLDYRIIINMGFLSFGERCTSPITSIFQIEVRGMQENPLSRGIGNFAGRTILLSGGNLTRSEFNI